MRKQSAAFLQCIGHSLNETIVYEKFIKNELRFLFKCDNILSNLFCIAALR